MLCSVLRPKCFYFICLWFLFCCGDFLFFINYEHILFYIFNTLKIFTKRDPIIFSRLTLSPWTSPVSRRAGYHHSWLTSSTTLFNESPWLLGGWSYAAPFYLGFESYFLVSSARHKEDRRQHDNEAEFQKTQQGKQSGCTAGLTRASSRLAGRDVSFEVIAILSAGWKEVFITRLRSERPDSADS